MRCVQRMSFLIAVLVLSTGIGCTDSASLPSEEPPEAAQAAAKDESVTAPPVSPTDTPPVDTPPVDTPPTQKRTVDDPQAIAKLKERGGFDIVDYRDEGENRTVYSVTGSTSEVCDDDIEPLCGLAKLRDVEFYEHNRITDAGLKRICEIGDLVRLYMTSNYVTDAGVAHVATLKTLTSLTLSSEAITDASLEHVKDLPNLTDLCFFRTQVTCAGLKDFKSFSTIESLNLNSSPATDELIPVLEAMPALKHLNLKKTKLTEAGIQRLEQALPDVKIRHDKTY